MVPPIYFQPRQNPVLPTGLNPSISDSNINEITTRKVDTKNKLHNHVFIIFQVRYVRDNWYRICLGNTTNKKRTPDVELSDTP